MDIDGSGATDWATWGRVRFAAGLGGGATAFGFGFAGAAAFARGLAAWSDG
jgi:hypothetical protein